MQTAATVTDNLVSDNYVCYGAGGGIYAEDSTVNGNIVYNNLAYIGGGIWVHGGMATGNTVSGNSVKGNLAGDGTGYGGGIYLEMSTAERQFCLRAIEALKSAVASWSSAVW